jgi:ABC-type multidrug transport system ATPase subunit
MKASQTDNFPERTRQNGISISNLTKVYGSFKAVDSLNLEISPGDLFGFLGPNGAGKTTTIRILCGLLSPSSGRATVAGYDAVKDSIKIRNIIGLLPESSGFYNWMNAREYLSHFAQLYRIESSLARTRIDDLLEKVGLAGRSFAPIAYYSRGMKQRLGLARTLINDPQILFLDEPTLGLDPKGQLEIQKVLIELNRDKGVTIFLSSHALAEVPSLCNRMAIINRGTLVAHGTINQLRKLAGEEIKVNVRVLKMHDVQSRLSRLPFQFEIEKNVRSQEHIDEEAEELIRVIISEKQASVNDIVQEFQRAGLKIFDIQRLNMPLEKIFFNLIESGGKKQQVQLEPSKAGNVSNQSMYDISGKIAEKKESDF